MENKPVKKKFYKRWWFWVIIVIIFLAISGSNTPAPAKVGANTAASTPQQTIFKVGDNIKAGNTILTVKGVNRNWHSSNQFDTPNNSSDVYVVVTVSLGNVGSSDMNLSGGFGDFKLQDATGLIVDPSFGGTGLNKLSTGSLTPGGTTSGDILFEVPRTATTKMTLIYQPPFSETLAKIELQ